MGVDAPARTRLRNLGPCTLLCLCGGKFSCRLKGITSFRKGRICRIVLATASGGRSLSHVMLCMMGDACRPICVGIRRHSNDQDRVAVAECRANLGLSSSIFIFGGRRCPATRVVSLEWAMSFFGHG